MIQVKATREGLIGKTTATGYVIDTIVPFVALPAEEAKFLFVQVVNPLNMLSCLAIVLDVGPWYTDDNAYVFSGARPMAEQGTNGSGIDLSEAVWAALDMKDNTQVMWSFVRLS